MATLSILCSYSLELQGRTYAGKQGSADDDVDTPFDVTLTSGIAFESIGVLATATARTIWDEDSFQPVDIQFGFFWCDVDMYIQFIGQATNVVFPVEAKIPFTISANTLLAAANTTALSGSAPSVEAIDSIVIQNNSGGSGNYHLALFS